MVSFKVDCPQTAIKVLERVSLILYAESLGGVESLITYPMLQTHADVPENIRAVSYTHLDVYKRQARRPEYSKL